MATVKIIGAGLAGAEAAWQASRLGIDVKLYEMKPTRFSPAHSYKGMAELVCSNSLRSDAPENAVGILKAEMSELGSIVMESAFANRVPAGSCLAVDREGFSDYITEKLISQPNIEVINEELSDFDPDDGITVVATGPLTDGAMAEYIKSLLGCGSLSFFDAAAPIVDRSSVDFESAFIASRWGKGEAAYINCPMTREEYDVFYNELITAKTAELHGFDGDMKVFEGCMPVEVMASRGYETLLFGPMKPVGLTDPRTGKEPFAAVQLRQDNKEGTMYNIVGFQTHLTFPEQKRVFGLIPALGNAEFLRYGVMHRNTFTDSPRLMTPYYSLRERRNIFFAGQMTGVEGYLESASSGMVSGINAARLALGEEEIDFTSETAIGALANYISNPSVTVFQPMNVNFGIIAPLDHKVKGGKKARNAAIGVRCVEKIKEIKEKYGL